MDIRREMMGVIAGMASGDLLPTGWKKTTIVYTDSGITKADALATFLSNSLPNCKYAFGTLNRDMTIAPTHNTVTAFMWSYNNASCSTYQRARNATYQPISNWTSTYDVIVETGATFTVIYVE